MTMYAKRMAAILAVLIMAATIAGCNTKKDKPKEKTERAMGRYVEKTIAMPKAVEKGKEHAYQMVRNAEGKPEIYSFDGKDYKDVTQYRFKEDNTWVKDNPPWLKQNSMSIDAVTCTADGTRYAIVRKRSVGGSKQKVKIVKISNNENCEEIVIKDLSKETGNNTSPNIPIGIEVSKDNQILLEFSDRMSLYENGKIKYSFKKGGHDYALSDNKLLLINEKTDGVLIADLNTGKIISEIPCADSIEWNVFTADRQGNWYMVSNLGIQRLANGGNRWETILDGSMASMGEPSLTPDTVLMGKDGGFYVMYMRNGGTREIKYYVYDKDAPTIPSKTLSIVALDENSTIRQGIAEFQKINKDVRVDYKTAETQKENGSIADFDYIMAMNTQLLAGKGADIILLDGIPIDSYIEKGVLADLSEVINPLLDQKEVLGNMIEPYKTEGKIYTAPVRFGIPIAF